MATIADGSDALLPHRRGPDVTTFRTDGMASYLREVRPEHFLGCPGLENLYPGITAAVAATQSRRFERALEWPQGGGRGVTVPPHPSLNWPPPGQVDAAAFKVRAVAASTAAHRPHRSLPIPRCSTSPPRRALEG